ncbi:MAG: hypothetical protein JSW68_11495, partial [Burkholderiales bacterium]
NTASRVPALVLDDGTVLTESLLILMWAERDRPQPALLGANPAAALSLAGIAMGVIDAAVHTIVGRVITSGVPTDRSFDDLPVGLRRRRSMTTGFARLDEHLGGIDATQFDVVAMTSIAALDYVDFRFPAAPWLPDLPNVRALRAAHAERASIAQTVPHD